MEKSLNTVFGAVENRLIDPFIPLLKLSNAYAGKLLYQRLSDERYNLKIDLADIIEINKRLKKGILEITETTETTETTDPRDRIITDPRTRDIIIEMLASTYPHVSEKDKETLQHFKQLDFEKVHQLENKTLRKTLTVLFEHMGLLTLRSKLSLKQKGLIAMALAGYEITPEWLIHWLLMKFAHIDTNKLLPFKVSALPEVLDSFEEMATVNFIGHVHQMAGNAPHTRPDSFANVLDPILKDFFSPNNSLSKALNDFFNSTKALQILITVIEQQLTTNNVQTPKLHAYIRKLKIFDELFSELLKYRNIIRDFGSFLRTDASYGPFLRSFINNPEINNMDEEFIQFLKFCFKFNILNRKDFRALATACDEIVPTNFETSTEAALQDMVATMPIQPKNTSPAGDTLKNQFWQRVYNLGLAPDEKYPGLTLAKALKRSTFYIGGLGKMDPTDPRFQYWKDHCTRNTTRMITSNSSYSPGFTLTPVYTNSKKSMPYADTFIGTAIKWVNNANPAKIANNIQYISDAFSMAIYARRNDDLHKLIQPCFANQLIRVDFLLQILAHHFLNLPPNYVVTVHQDDIEDAIRNADEDPSKLKELLDKTQNGFDLSIITAKGYNPLKSLLLECQRGASDTSTTTTSGEDSDDKDQLKEKKKKEKERSKEAANLMTAFKSLVTHLVQTKQIYVFQIDLVEPILSLEIQKIMEDAFNDLKIGQQYNPVAIANKKASVNKETVAKIASQKANAQPDFKPETKTIIRNYVFGNTETIDMGELLLTDLTETLATVINLMKTIDLAETKPVENLSKLAEDVSTYFSSKNRVTTNSRRWDNEVRHFKARKENPSPKSENNGNGNSQSSYEAIAKATIGETSSKQEESSSDFKDVLAAHASPLNTTGGTRKGTNASSRTETLSTQQQRSSVAENTM